MNKVRTPPEYPRMRTLRPRVIQLVGFAVGLLCGLVWSQMSPTPAEASRNGSGTYTLPSGNPVVSGTTITSAWANNTLNDIATELTSSLDRAGRGAMTAALQLASGTSSAPGLTFSAENTSGIYRFGTNDLRMQVASTNRQKWTSTGSDFVTEAVTMSGAADGGVALTVTGGANGGSGTQGAAIVATGGSSYGPAIVATGTGGASAIVVTGSGSGDAISVTAGSSGSAIEVTGPSSGSEPAIKGTAIAGNGSGVYGVGAGSGSGVTGITSVVNGSGVVGIASGSGSYGGFFQGSISATAALYAVSASSTSTTRYKAVQVAAGDVSFLAPTAPLTTTSMTNSLTAANIIKAWATISLANPPVLTTSVGFNVASISCAANEITVNIEADMSSANYVATITGANTGSTIFSHGTRSVGSFNIIAYDAAGVVVNLCTYAPSSGSVNFMLVGVQ